MLTRLHGCAHTHQRSRAAFAIPSVAMSDAAQQMPNTTGTPSVWPRIMALLAAALAIVALAVWIVGPSPKAADDGFPDQPPPLAIPSDVAQSSPLAVAAAKLSTGDLDVARASFTNIVAEDRDDVPGQVGLIMSRWRSTGPTSVERDLTQLAKEFPDSAFVALHLGLVRTSLQQDRGAREALRETIELGLDAGDDTSLRMARLADDLLHPEAFRGELPVLVAPGEIGAADRPALRALLAAFRAGDRREVARLAEQLGQSSDDLTRVAVITATFDKDEPEATSDRLRHIAGSRSSSPEARDRARLLGALADLWGGGPRADACQVLRQSARPATDAATRRLAKPIAAELCA